MTTTADRTSSAPRLVAQGRYQTSSSAAHQAGRLAIVAGLSAMGALAMALLTYAGGSDVVVARESIWIVTSLSFILSSTVLVISQRPTLSPKTARALGFTLLIVSSAVSAWAINSVQWPAELKLPGWSPTTVWVLFALLILGYGPKTTLLIGLVAAATEPIIVLTLEAMGVITLPPFTDVVLRLGAAVTGPLLAMIASVHLSRLQDKLHEAQELGSYKLTERLGKGGMGEVWRATHTMLKRPAAVKLISPDKLGNDGATLVQRFEIEAQATAALKSPHTINVYDFGVTRDGDFFYVMELLDGVDLETLVERFGPQPAERVVHLLRQACHSLAEAHSHGLIHRDIKPANMFVCRFGLEVDHLKILDFGLVKALHQGPKEPRLTTDGVISGTPAYMAPEQVIGEGVDARTDIYALGCVAYWLLTGRDPFLGRTATQVMFAHLQSPPPPPSTVTELDVPPEVDAIVLACLEKKPDDRPDGAISLRQRLDALSLDSAWSQERAARWWDRQLPAGGSTKAPLAGASTVTAR